MNFLEFFLQLAIVFLLLLLLYFLGKTLLPRIQTRNQLPLPPRPPGHFLLGNLYEVLKATKDGSQHLLFHKWSQEYGDIFGVQVGPLTEYFINSDVAVKDLFDRQSAQTAERPRWIVSNELICGKLNVLLLNASDQRWKHQRKAIHIAMTSVPQADAGLPFLHYETAKFMYEVSNNPSVGNSSANLWTAIGRYTYSTFASQTFGMDIPDIDNPVIQYIHETGLAQILFTLPGSNMVDIFPWLSNLPLLFKPWEREGRARFKRDMEWCVDRLYRIKKGKASNIMQDAFLPKVLEDEKHLGFSTLEEPSYLALMLIMGAADTSRMSTWSFLEAMMMFPDVQEKGHREVERVVGDRLPVYADLEQIPYIRCVMKEVWRWRPPVALGHPHTTTRELVYGGYRIPKGARLHLNSWAIGHNPRRHVDPERFWPERYADDLTNSTQSMHSSDVRRRDHFAFGSGRRVCPGINVAERSLAVAIMRILWAFKIASAPGAKLPLDPADYRADMPGNPGTNLPVMLTVRSEKKRVIIDQAFKEANESRAALEPLA